jgi:hypothetical protein
MFIKVSYARNNFVARRVSFPAALPAPAAPPFRLPPLAEVFQIFAISAPPFAIAV